MPKINSMFIGLAGALAGLAAITVTGAEEAVVTPDAMSAASAPLYLISEIQGDGAATPLEGVTVTVEALVVGDFQNNAGKDHGQLRGFFIQEEPVDYDDSDATSEGLFVFDNNGAVNVATGDRVRVTGTASEYYGMTQLSASAVDVLSSGEPLPPSVGLDLPASSQDGYEAVEGMRVTFAQSLQISEYYNYDRFGEIVLALPLDGEPRAMTPTAVEEPGSNGHELRAERNLNSRLLLDDGNNAENPVFSRHPNGDEFTGDNRFRGGDSVSDVTGVMHYAFDAYRLQPTAGANYSASNPRPALPEVGGNLRVASMNVLNYFTTIDRGEETCGPAGNLECRGADSELELSRQRDKIVAALAAMDAAIVGLIEIENDSGQAAEDLVAALNNEAGEGSYAALETGAIGSDAIKVAFVYQPALVSPLGDHAILDASVDPDFIDGKNRPALAQTFTTPGGAKLTVAVNHFKSKGSDCEDIGDPDLGDGQGNCNLTRSNAASALSDWLAADPTGQGADRVLVLGDLNAYDKEDPIDALTGDGYEDLLARFAGEFGYSYVFDGQFGYLDYALANEALAGHVSGAAAWHINADEPDILDYDTSYKSDSQAALYTPDAFRSSDHDPILVGLNLSSQPARYRDCLGDGWRKLRREDGSAFRNRGQCVAYVNQLRRQAWLDRLWEFWQILHSH